MKQIVDKLNKIAKAIDENVDIPESNLITDSLDAITTALGGTPNDSSLIVDKLEDIAGVATGGGGSNPTGTISITSNGNYDVSSYRSAEVDVSNTITQTIPFFNNSVTLQEVDGIYTAGLSWSSPYLLNTQTMRVRINNGEWQQYPVYFDVSTGDYRIGDEDTRYRIFGNAQDNYADIEGPEAETISLYVSGTNTGVRCSMRFYPGSPRAPLLLGHNGSVICGVNITNVNVAATYVIPYDNQNLMPFIAFVSFGDPK